MEIDILGKDDAYATTTTTSTMMLFRIKQMSVHINQTGIGGQNNILLLTPPPQSKLFLTKWVKCGAKDYMNRCAKLYDPLTTYITSTSKLVLISYQGNHEQERCLPQIRQSPDWTSADHHSVTVYVFFRTKQC